MTTSWTEKDKAVFKNIIPRVLKRANENALKAFRSYTVDTVEQLWKLEQEIRNWRRERTCIYVKYDGAEARMSEWIRRGWLKMSEIQNLSEERLARIRKKV